MNRSAFLVVAVIAVAAIGGYLLFMPTEIDRGATQPTAATATVDVDATTQAAIDFCETRGGAVEQITAAEGVVYLCDTGDGTKIEVGQFMANNKTE